MRHRAGHAISAESFARRGGAAAAGAAADRRGNQFPGALRHHRRKPHAEPRRTAARGGNHDRRSAAHQDARGGRRRRQQHRARDRNGARVQGPGRGRNSFRQPLLQQADAGRPLPALQGDCRGGFAADHSLQHSRAHGREYRAGDDGAARRNREHRRREGSLGKYCADGGGAGERAGAVPGAFRRRWNHDSADGARRARPDFRGLE